MTLLSWVGLHGSTFLRNWQSGSVEPWVEMKSVQNSIRAQCAQEFATALDTEDYESARRLLAGDCIYHFSGKSFRGIAAILESYQQNAEWVKRTFESIVYESSTRQRSDDTWVIHYIDRIQHRDRELEHHCEQVVRFDSGNRVVEITHIDLPGEDTKVKEFLAAFDIARE